MLIECGTNELKLTRSYYRAGLPLYLVAGFGPTSLGVLPRAATYACVRFQGTQLPLSCAAARLVPHHPYDRPVPEHVNMSKALIARS